MIGRTWWLLAFVPLALWPQEHGGVHAFVHAALVDPVSGQVEFDRTVIVDGDRVAAIVDARDEAVPVGAEIVDTHGKYLMPGLWDMHVHLTAPDVFFPLFLAHGVTGVRDMGNSVDDFEHLRQWRAEIARRERLGPRILAASPILDGSRLTTLGFFGIRSAVDGRRAVGRFAAEGADFLKVLDLLPREVYFGIAAEAARRHISFAGHVPLSVGALAASRAGQRSIEHLSGVLEGSSASNAALDRALYRRLTTTDLPDAEVIRELWFVRSQAYLDSYNERRAQALFAAFRVNGTWQCPTLVLLRGWLAAKDHAGQAVAVRYLPATMTSGWEPARNLFSRNLTAADWTIVAAVHRRQRALIAPLHGAGVPLLAGTDTNGDNPFLVPGESLHEELAMLVDAGLTPAEALQAATINAARWAGRDRELGTIIRGKIADFVVLDANPLVDIRNVAKINAVVIGGTLLNRLALDRMLVAVQATAQRRR